MECKLLAYQLLKLAAVILFITFFPNIPPHVSFKAFNVKRPQNVNSSINTWYLDNAEQLFKGEILGPEAFAVFNNSVYTGLHGGFVVRVDENSITPIVKFGMPCDDLTEERKCGRPLGMKFDKNGILYVADAYYGIFKYDIEQGESTHLVRGDEEIEGKRSMFYNDVAVASDGTVYFTISSTTFPLYEGVQVLLAPGDGRLMKYDPRTRRSSVLVEDILFPNGIEISSYDEYLLISDSVGSRVHKYHLKGPKKNTMEIFAEGLPGIPDNIRSDGAYGFFVSMVVPADETHPVLPQVLGPFPNVRKFISRVIYLVELPFTQLNKIYPNYICNKIAHMIGHFSSTKYFLPKGITIVHLNPEGKIKGYLIGRDGSVSHVSDMVILDRGILLGSPYNDFIGRVPLPNPSPGARLKSTGFKAASQSTSTGKETVKTAADGHNVQGAARKTGEEVGKKTPEEEKAKKEAAKRAAEEVKEKKAAEDAAKRAAEEAYAKKAAEDAAKRAAEEVKAKKAAEEAAKRAAEEAKAKKAAEDAAKRAAEEAEAKKVAQEAAKRAAEEVKAKKTAEDAAKRAAEDAKVKKVAEDAAKRAAEEIKVKMVAEEAAKQAAEEAKTKKASEHAAESKQTAKETKSKEEVKKSGKEINNKKFGEEAAEKKAAEEAMARRDSERRNEVPNAKK